MEQEFMYFAWKLAYLIVLASIQLAVKKNKHWNEHNNTLHKTKDYTVSLDRHLKQFHPASLELTHFQINFFC